MPVPGDRLECQTIDIVHRISLRHVRAQQFLESQQSPDLHPDMARADSVHDINGLAIEAIDRYRRIENLPYELIVQTLASFEGRRKRTRPLK